MFKISLKIFLALLFLLKTGLSYSQNIQQPFVTGKVIDSLTRKPLDFITVSVVDDVGNPVASGYTNADGVYNLPVKKAGALKEAYSFVGYAKKTLSINITSQQNILILGELSLAQDVKSLNEVQVTATKKLVVQRTGMLIYNSGNDPSNKGGTAADVLRKAPVKGQQ